MSIFRFWSHRSPGWAVGFALVLDALAATAAHAATVTGDPGVRLRRVLPETGDWRTSYALAIEMELEHPILRLRTTPDPWLLAPTDGWMAAARLVVTGPDGKDTNWPFRVSATRPEQPLRLEPSETASVFFLLDPRAMGLRVLPGRYTVRGELAAGSGEGWRGRVETAPLEVNVLGPVAPEVRVETPDASPLVAGWPWGVAVAVAVPPDPDAVRLTLPGRTSTGWISNLQFSVRDATGREVSWPWVMPRLAGTSTDWLDPGDSSEAVYFRLPATATADLVPGEYTVRVRFRRPPLHADERDWSGSVESEPVVVSVAPKPASPGSDEASRRDRLEAMDALAEAADLRFVANDGTLGLEGQVAQLRRTVEPLLRAESAAIRLLLLHPSDPGTFLLMSRVRLAQDDPLGALAWADGARGLASPGTNDSPASFGSPEEGWRDLASAWRTRVESMPEVPDSKLSPELEFALNLARGTLPEPTTFEEQEKYFGADPDGQWAASARASSEYRAADYSAARATGAPNVRFYGDNVQAWATRLADAADEWIELTFANPVRADAVRVRQNFNPGAIARVDLFDASGGMQTVFQGVDTNVYARSAIGWFVVAFPTTERPIERVRLTLDSVRVRGWNEIDAVQLVRGAVVVEERPRLVVGLPDLANGRLPILGWPSGYRLERAERLDPAAWVTVATQPPVSIPLTSPQGFFRLAK